MDPSESKTFTCTLISPAGRLLDCAATSVVFPAHDGQVGILYGHMPMLCQIGLGLMNVKVSSENAKVADLSPERSFFLDDGFALVAKNSLTVVAYEAIALRDIKAETLKSMIEETSRAISDPASTPKQRTRDNRRVHILKQITQSIKP